MSASVSRLIFPPEDVDNVSICCASPHLAHYSSPLGEGTRHKSFCFLRQLGASGEGKAEGAKMSTEKREAIGFIAHDFRSRNTRRLMMTESLESISLTKSAPCCQQRESIHRYRLTSERESKRIYSRPIIPGAPFYLKNSSIG